MFPETKILKLFYIEDDPGDVFFIKIMFSGINKEQNSLSPKFELAFADQLSKGIEGIKNTNVDLILLDLGLPDGNGAEMIYQIRHEGIHQPIIVLTNREDENYAVHTVRSGAQDYLLKGEIDHTMFLRSIFYAIERQKLQNELKKAIEQIDTLHGLFPICAQCKQIKDDKGYWCQIEHYIAEHTDVKFSHGYCPKCAQAFMDEANKMQLMMKDAGRPAESI